MSERSTHMINGAETGCAEKPCSTWEEEEIFIDGDRFFRSLLAGIAAASYSVDLETYIFEQGVLGERVSLALMDAAKRGVAVRLLVDGIGSFGWAPRHAARLRTAGVEVRVFHQLVWEHLKSIPAVLMKVGHFMNSLGRLNHRNHRKLCIVDQQTAWVGSLNVSDAHLREVRGALCWRDTGARLRGSPVQEFVKVFQTSWSKRLRRRTLREWRKQPSVHSECGIILHNTTMRSRHKNYKDLLQRVSRASARIWITASYFVPPHSLLTELCSAARRGCDVRLLLPGRSDHFFMPWTTTAFYPMLHAAGVATFEYTPRVLHAKSIIIDDWFLVGSSNLNHRSLLHDLELDVVLTMSESKKLLVAQFLSDESESLHTSALSWTGRPWWQRTLGRLVLAARYVL